ncbi:MAG: RNA methyltransferase [Ignavibacteriaceae bacterium]
MEAFKTEKRKQKIISVVHARQKSLRIVLENIHDPHNVSAIFRTCDAVGVTKVSLLYTVEKFPKIGKKSSASAFKWVEKEKFKDVEACYNNLRTEGFLILASSICSDAVSLFDLDLTQKTAIVLGNEHRGVSEEAVKLADKKFLIPMCGMVQSLNVSVASAVVLYEAFRQRFKKNMYKKTEYSSEEMEELLQSWYMR